MIEINVVLKNLDKTRKMTLFRENKAKASADTYKNIAKSKTIFQGFNLLAKIY